MAAPPSPDAPTGPTPTSRSVDPLSVNPANGVSATKFRDNGCVVANTGTAGEAGRAARCRPPEEHPDVMRIARP